MIRFCTLLLIAPLLLSAATAEAAQNADELLLEQSMPSDANLAALEARMHAEPDNLDHYFAYAQMARTLGKTQEAAAAYEYMLQKNPGLSRVKLELALVYVELGKFPQARTLLQNVSAEHPPQAVQNNINGLMEFIDARTRRHHIGGSFSFGFNSDSNANAAPSSGNISILDTTIPLGDGAQEKRDVHVFSALTLTHSYAGGERADIPDWKWNSSALLYGTEQDALDDLNIQYYSLKTGPEFFFPDMRMRVSTAGSYNHIILDSFTYLLNPKMEATFERGLADDVVVYYTPLYEYRDFRNSPLNTTYSSRSGLAWQHVFGVRHAVSKSVMLDFATLLRREQAKESYYANSQAGVSLNGTYSIREDLFTVFGTGYKVSSFDQPDFLISSSIREDDEYYGSIMLGKKLYLDFTGELLILGGYQYRHVWSNIQNYEYENHRLSLSMTKNF